MTILILGLVLFLGVHATRIVADGWRSRTLANVGEKAYKGGYTLVSLAGFALIVWGVALARRDPVVLWAPPYWTHHVTGLFMLAAIILLVATYVPFNGIKARVHHPMVLAVKVWALGHLLANGTLADVLLFGGFLVWAVFSFAAARRRDRAAQALYPPGTARATATTVAVGVLAWAAFAFWGHRVLIGVQPFTFSF